MNEHALLHRLAVALAVGLIVGLERAWKTRDEHGGLRLAGIRTFALAGVFGGVTAALGEPAPGLLLAAGIVAVGALVVAGYVLDARERRDFGITTELALLTTYALGAGAVAGFAFEAAAAAIVLALMLGFKTEVHRAISGLERNELLATLQLLLIAAVLVPLLPARDLGPYGAINPRVVGMLVLLIAGLSYVGYFAVRVLGPRLGLLLTAVFGGLSSSTAVTVAYARRARGSGAGPAALLGTGIAVAAATMAPRLGAELAIVNGTVLVELWPTLLALTLVPLAPLAVPVFARASKAVQPGEPGMKLSNPLQLRSALVFGGLLSVLFIAASAVQAMLGDAGVYATAAVAGLVDVDAIGLTLAREAGRGIDARTAERGIALAAIVNTLAKAAIAVALGGRVLLRSTLPALLLAAAAAAVTAALTLH